LSCVTWYFILPHYHLPFYCRGHFLTIDLVYLECEFSQCHNLCMCEFRVEKTVGKPTKICFTLNTSMISHLIIIWLGIIILVLFLLYFYNCSGRSVVTYRPTVTSHGSSFKTDQFYKFYLTVTNLHFSENRTVIYIKNYNTISNSVFELHPSACMYLKFYTKQILNKIYIPGFSY